MPKRILIFALFLSVFICTISSFSEELSTQDINKIHATLSKLQNAILNEDIDSLMSCMSAHMSPEEYAKIKEVMSEKFNKYDYTEYRFSIPADIKVVRPGEKVKFKTRYDEKYTFDSSGSGSTHGLTSKFTMEKQNGRWLILDTDFYSKKGFFKVLSIAVGGSVILGILFFAFWIWMLIDCAKREFPDSNDKVVWILVIVLLQVIGAIVYYFVIRRKEK